MLVGDCLEELQRHQNPPFETLMRRFLGSGDTRAMIPSHLAALFHPSKQRLCQKHQDSREILIGTTSPKMIEFTNWFTNFEAEERWHWAIHQLLAARPSFDMPLGSAAVRRPEKQFKHTDVRRRQHKGQNL